MKSSKRRSRVKSARNKKPYQPPQLVTYGDLRRLTNMKLGSTNDGHGKPHTRMGMALPP
jgi:hypothetical protein